MGLWKQKCEFLSRIIEKAKAETLKCGDAEMVNLRPTSFHSNTKQEGCGGGAGAALWTSQNRWGANARGRERRRGGQRV